MTKNKAARRYRIWALWTDLAEDTGAVIAAESADRALALASMRGLFCGLGANRRYLGAHAQEVV